MSDLAAIRPDGPAPEREIARDIVRRGLIVAPVFLVTGLLWGWDGVASVAYALAIVLVNFLLAAAFMSWGARVSLGLLMGAAMGGFALRMGLVALAVLAVINQGWVVVVPLGLTLIVSHLGLLVWEARHVSASLAYPGLKPKPVAAGSTKE